MNKSTYHAEYAKIPDPRKKKKGELMLAEQRRREDLELERKTLEAHRMTIFTGGYDKEDDCVLHGYSEGDIL